ncbi:hypothetical protein VTK56DRAFT_9923 [Thermocarpiscus australiensis]
MRFSSRIDGSICGAILFWHRPSLSSHWSAAATPLPACGYSRGGGPAQSFRGGCTIGRSVGAGKSKTRAHHPCRPLFTVSAPSISCIRSGSRPGPSRTPQRWSHTAAATETGPDPEFDDTDSTPPQEPSPAPSHSHSPPRQPKPLTKEELLALVSPYDNEEIGSVDEYLRLVGDPYMRGYAAAYTNRILFARTREDVDYPSLEQVIEAGEEEQRTLFELRFAVLTRLRSPHKVDLDDIYEIYRRLPEPRMLYIHARFRHQLLRALGQPEKQNAKSMLRYFSVIADVKNTGIPLTTTEWNCAIAFASNYVGRATEAETEAALKLWREMELEAGIEGTDVTFNILFDVASKAGNFTLAEMIYREMEARGHRYNRYHYTSLIHFFGLKLETGGMRAAYKEMVEAGEVIDTVVLNAMISGLLRSGEEAAAERLYERMKEASLADIGADTTAKHHLPVRTPTSDRAITQALQMFAKLNRRFPTMQPVFQDMALIAPDLQTYRILVNHYGVRKGDLARVAAYVDEMKFFSIPLHHAIFLALFKGFARHGGYPRSAWSAQRLEGIWAALVQAIDGRAAASHRLEIRTWLAVWALRAFARCSTHDRVLDVYGALKARWRLSHAEEQFMIDFLSGLVGSRY